MEKWTYALPLWEIAATTVSSQAPNSEGFCHGPRTLQVIAYTTFM